MDNGVGKKNLFVVDELTDTSVLSGKRKIKLDEDTKLRMHSLIQYFPSAMTAAGSSTLYKVSFPEGVPHVLTKLKRGGYTTIVRDPDSKKIVAHASLTPMTGQAVLLGAFTAMSMATGQYFLSEINSKLTIISSKLDSILEFLYGDKKAELIAEINYIRYVYTNYETIMECPEQRIATITSLQESQKTAMKDIEFYMADLERAVNEEVNDEDEMKNTVSRSLQIQDSINMSLQLYALTVMLIIYYSQNATKEHTSYLREELTLYIDKCDKHALSDLSKLRQKTDTYENSGWFSGKFEKEPLLKEIDARIEVIHNSKQSDRLADIFKAIDSFGQPADFYIDKDGEVYT